MGLTIGREKNDAHISPRGVTFVEVLLAPRSAAEGSTLKDMEFRKQYGFTAVALLREGRSYRTDVAYMKLQMGDSLLMVGTPDHLQTPAQQPRFHRPGTRPERSARAPA